MIEIWSCGPEGAVASGFAEGTAERFALAAAALDGTLSRRVVSPGEYFELTPSGDMSPQRLVVYSDHARLYENFVEQGDERVRAAVKQVTISPQGLSRCSISYSEEPSGSGTPRLRLFWLVAYAQSTPEFDELRKLVREQ
jgi:hypothetical protein